jgi:hypothetical protein
VTTTTKNSRSSASMKSAVVPPGIQVLNSARQGIGDGRSVSPSSTRPTLFAAPVIPKSGTAELHGHRQSENPPIHARALESPVGAKPKAEAVTKTSSHVTSTSSSRLIKPDAVTCSSQLPSSCRERIGDEHSFEPPPENPTAVVPKCGRTVAHSPGGVVLSTTSAQVTTQSSLGWPQHTNRATTKLPSEERLRLAAEGRRMLQQARVSRGATRISLPSTEMPAPSSQEGRYPLRSRLAASGSRTNTAEKQTAPTVASIIGDIPDPAPHKNADQGDRADGWNFDDF